MTTGRQPAQRSGRGIAHSIHTYIAMPDDVYASALLVVKEIREPNLALLSCAIRRYSNLARPSDVIVSHIKKTYFYPTTSY